VRLLREILKGLLLSVVGAKDLAGDLAEGVEKKTLKRIKARYKLVRE
jgi:hypothetical protein